MPQTVNQPEDEFRHLWDLLRQARCTWRLIRRPDEAIVLEIDGFVPVVIDANDLQEPRLVESLKQMLGLDVRPIRETKVRQNAPGYLPPMFYMCR